VCEREIGREGERIERGEREGERSWNGGRETEEFKEVMLMRERKRVGGIGV
jgi:hypothetical protein